ncbi:peritrophin-1-like [Schistocerca nitens]|uniref:peritrophin-1-like n=1 Tax=Schistocerca nitens TaxID=7011 RepID=UPI002119A92D|nr:peritrophin-1-like [Schistocerca nitens]
MGIKLGVWVLACATLLLSGALPWPAGDCPRHWWAAAYLPDTRDCSVFYQCAHGVPVRFQCPAELHFNPHLCVCDYPMRAGCTSLHSLHHNSPYGPHYRDVVVTAHANYGFSQ